MNLCTFLGTLLFVVGATAASSPDQVVFDLASPDGAVQFHLLKDADNHLRYSVRSKGVSRIESSELGVVIDDLDSGASAQVGAPKIRRIHEIFPWRGNKSSGTNFCEAAEVPINSGNLNWTLEVRTFDDGVAFRYRIPGEGTRHVAGEKTSWLLAKESTVWFQTNTVHYEGIYQSRLADQVAAGTPIGAPLTAVFADGTYGLISEAALYHFSGMSLRANGCGGFETRFQHDPKGWNHLGPITSPWRVLILAKDLNQLVNSDLISALSDPPDPELFPQGVNTEWIRPGKAPCTWMVFGNDGAQWHRQKWFVDNTAAMGCEYLLVDAGWRTEKWGWLKDGGDVWARAAELCRYGAERNVGIILWHAYPDGRDDSPGLTTPQAREELFANCEKAGVKGVKIDFFDSESKSTIEAYEDLMRRAAQHHLMINFHGANKPAGEARTWPNVVSREGIREQEYVLWDSLPLSHYGALPFTRMVAGYGDFLPGYIQPRFLKNTTLAFQMASVVVFSSPFLCFPDNPEAYLASPFLEFIRNVPCAWDESRILPQSIIGDTVALARRKSESWYIALLNCRNESRCISIDLADFNLEGKKVTLYRDGSKRDSTEISSAMEPVKGQLQITFQAGGGALVHIAPPKKFSGWK